MTPENRFLLLWLTIQLSKSPSRKPNNHIIVYKFCNQMANIWRVVRDRTLEPGCDLEWKNR